jgi:hypothetical protein
MQYIALELEVDEAEYLEASYMSSLSLNLDAQMRLDYDDCINKNVLDSPNEWATNYITTHPLF